MTTINSLLSSQQLWPFCCVEKRDFNVARTATHLFKDKLSHIFIPCSCFNLLLSLLPFSASPKLSFRSHLYGDSYRYHGYTLSEQIHLTPYSVRKSEQHKVTLVVWLPLAVVVLNNGLVFMSADGPDANVSVIRIAKVVHI